MFWTHAALTVLVFPIRARPGIPLERPMYWAQHSLLVTIPVYVVWSEGEEEKFLLWDGLPQMFHWGAASYGLWILWFWGVMHTVALATMVNVGYMLCPWPEGPFGGPDYRMWGFAHQLAMFLAIGFIVDVIGRFGRRRRMQKIT